MATTLNITSVPSVVKIKWSEEIESLDKKIEKTKQNLISLNDQKKALESKITISCAPNVWGKGCGKSFEIGTLTYIQPYWYESPWGCTGGDTWHRDKEDGYFVCPACNHKNRLYNRPHYLAVADRFKNIKEVYER